MSIYAFSGETRSESGDDRRDVHCLSASLSEHDLDRVIGLSARALISMISVVDEILWTTLLTGFASHDTYLREATATKET